MVWERATWLGVAVRNGEERGGKENGGVRVKEGVENREMEVKWRLK